MQMLETEGFAFLTHESLGTVPAIGRPMIPDWTVLSV